jgi:hypothetical protein
MRTSVPLFERRRQALSPDGRTLDATRPCRSDFRDCLARLDVAKTPAKAPHARTVGEPTAEGRAAEVAVRAKHLRRLQDALRREKSLPM